MNTTIQNLRFEIHMLDQDLTDAQTHPQDRQRFIQIAKSRLKEIEAMLAKLN